VPKDQVVRRCVGPNFRQPLLGERGLVGPADQGQVRVAEQGSPELIDKAVAKPDEFEGGGRCSRATEADSCATLAD
jgi:hypothetical protein